MNEGNKWTRTLKMEVPNPLRWGWIMILTSKAGPLIPSFLYLKKKRKKEWILEMERMFRFGEFEMEDPNPLKWAWYILTLSFLHLFSQLHFFNIKNGFSKRRLIREHIIIVSLLDCFINGVESGISKNQNGGF